MYKDYHFANIIDMKFFPFVLSTLMTLIPTSVCLDRQNGFVVDSERPSVICVTGDGETFKKDIKIDVDTFGNKIVVTPEHNAGYQPKVFVGNFLNNGLEQLLYSVDSGGSGGFSFYEIFSLFDGKVNSIFNSDNFSPVISARYFNENIIEIDYQGQKLFMNYSNEGCKDVADCEIYISSVNTILPYYNISLGGYYLQVLQRVYGGYSANNYGYIVSLLQINEDGYDVVNIGVFSNFAFVNL